MDKYKLRALVSIVAAICLGAGLMMTLRSMKIGAGLNDDSQALIRLPVRQYAYWKNNFELSLADRVQIPSEDVLNFLRADNVKQGFSEVPVASNDEVAIGEIKQALQTLPEAIQEKLKKKLAAIYLVQQLGGSAVANSIYTNGPSSPEIAGFLALDTFALNKKANDWATWKDQSPFRDGTYSIRTTIANDSANDRIHAYQFILLHELGHILAIGTDIHPSWDTAGPLNSFPFSKLSWKEKGDWYEHNGANQIPKTVFYATEQNKRSGDEILSIYEALEKTSFVTLYASTNPFDDFAETFATYVHSQLMQNPYRVEILKGNDVVKTFELCFGQPRCKEKEDIVRAFIESP